ncbi:pyridoxamine 5'-phosphate oxidase family protein, partial [Kibdelosporangium lantanae]
MSKNSPSVPNNGPATSYESVDTTADHVVATQVWRALGRATFAVLGCVNATGGPRSSGVLYVLENRKLYVAVGADSWKARYIAADGRVAVT